jgi:hypothetical protein
LKAEAVAAGSDAGGELGADALIVEHKGQIAVRGATGENLDVPFGGAAGKFADDVAVDAIEMSEAVAVPIVPLPGEVGHVGLIGLLEFGAIGFSAGGALLEIFDEAGFETFAGQLFEEDGREADGDGRAGFVEGALADHFEEREVGFGGGFVKPGLAVGMGAVVEDVGEVAVEDDTESAQGLAHDGPSWVGEREGVEKSGKSATGVL